MSVRSRKRACWISLVVREVSIKWLYPRVGSDARVVLPPLLGNDYCIDRIRQTAEIQALGA